MVVLTQRWTRAVMAKRYIVGIDLGTTHTVVGYASLDAALTPDAVRIFPIEQLVAAGQVAARNVLPSFRYHPIAEEFRAEHIALPWSNPPLSEEDVPYIGGEFGREMGAKVEGRLVASAKSWLSHDQVDRTAPILPWGAEEAQTGDPKSAEGGVGQSGRNVAKVSPVVASASYLAHVRNAWNAAHPEAPLEQQEIILTVPASFDEAARAYTLEAAHLSGLTQIRLLEEPQAVCYDWFLRHREQAPALLGDARLMLVVDVGGGTTDLSLIRVELQQGELKLTRIAVGDHLMLGGDNLDLALAHTVETRLNGDARKLSVAALSQLLQQTRNAKEQLLASEGPESVTVTLLGGGRKLIGAARSAVLTRAEVNAVALDGFLPITPYSELPQRRRSAVVEFGLPYVADPAISRHLAAFFHAHEKACRAALGNKIQPDAAPIADCVIYNGGFFQAKVLRERLGELLESWSSQPVRLLENAHPDYAVALGAVTYGITRRKGERIIGGGSARSFFLLVDDADGQRHAVCLLPKGSEEGREIELPERRFVLRLGQPVAFPLASFSGDRQFLPGEVISAEDDAANGNATLLKLPPLMARLDVQGGVQPTVEVRLTSTLTETGVLRVDCVDTGADQRRWALEFSVRRAPRSVNTADLPQGFEDAAARIADVFIKSDRQFDPKRVKSLREDIEKRLRSRNDWDIPLLRALFDELLKGVGKRRRSLTHERVWFNLAGFCLRPGFGYPLDDWRIEQVWPLFEQGLQFPQENQSWAEWWTFWRRAAGGLKSEQQGELLAAISKYIDPTHSRNSKIQTEVKTRSYEDMVRLAGSLEHLPVASKVQLAEWFVARLAKSAESATTWWALGRVASRVPFHGSAHSVVPKHNVEAWLQVLLREDWKKNSNAAFAAVMMSRMSGDRVRDIDDALRQQVLEKLKASKASSLWLSLVSEVVELDEGESKRVFGEALPIGLTLI
ncbi:DnaK-related protein [gamma proteobacterium HdN1]|nr:DnaK-related protein [gamma proteobacterium HdN1]